jgi:hypothetical protein
MYSKKKLKCLEATKSKLLLATCDEKKKGQKWEWKETYVVFDN